MRGGSLHGGGIYVGVRGRQIIQHTLVYGLIAAMLIIELMPLAWMFSTSFKTLEQ